MIQCLIFSALQCVAVCCSMLQYVAVCCSVLQCVALPERKNNGASAIHLIKASVLQYVAVCCSVLQHVAVCCSVLQCVAVRCSMFQCFQCVAVCCSILQCVAMPRRKNNGASAIRLTTMLQTSKYFSRQENDREKKEPKKYRYCILFLWKVRSPFNWELFREHRMS